MTKTVTPERRIEIAEQIKRNGGALSAYISQPRADGTYLTTWGDVLNQADIATLSALLEPTRAQRQAWARAEATVDRETATRRRRR